MILLKSVCVENVLLVNPVGVFEGGLRGRALGGQQEKKEQCTAEPLTRENDDREDLSQLESVAVRNRSCLKP